MKTKMKGLCILREEHEPIFSSRESIFLIHLLERQIYLRGRKEYRPLFSTSEGALCPKPSAPAWDVQGTACQLCGSLGGEVRQDPSVWKRSLFQRHPGTMVRGPLPQCLWKNCLCFQQAFSKISWHSFKSLNLISSDLKIDVGRSEIYTRHTKWEGRPVASWFITASPPFLLMPRNGAQNTSILQSIFFVVSTFLNEFFLMRKYFVSVLNVENTIALRQKKLL